MSDQLMRPGHWVMLPHENIAPVRRVHVTRETVRAAARYAIRRATANGTILDFDPDSLVITLEYALFGPFAPLVDARGGEVS